MTKTPHEIGLLLLMILAKQSVTRCHGHLLGLSVRAVRLLMVFHTRLSDRVLQLLRYILLECLRSGQPHKPNVW